jgi:hypothetical protein
LYHFKLTKEFSSFGSSFQEIACLQMKVFFPFTFLFGFCCILSGSISYRDSSSFLRRRLKFEKEEFRTEEERKAVFVLKNDRFDYLLLNQSSNNHATFHRNKENNELVVFIAITSGPHHSHLRHAIRNSWILPCIASSCCDYRFFVDSTPISHPSLEQEQLSYSDLLFRDSCSLMKAHPNGVNYGNSPPIGEFMKIKKINESDPKHSVYYEDLPDYPIRRRYKIDWKVCFMKWINQRYYHYSYRNLNITDVDEKDDNSFYDSSTGMNRYLGSAYHVYVEDDSFICSENLIFQLSLLYNISKTRPTTEFRTGTPMYDGFDDSSTIMSSKISRSFVRHYLEDNFNCSRIFNDTYSLPIGSQWLSWGNSWMDSHCGWASAIMNNYHYEITAPLISCSAAKLDMKNLNLSFPCLKRPLIFHNRDAMESLLKQHPTRQIYHMCEYMLLIDKVKSPELMEYFWNNAAIANHFHNFTSVFLADGSTSGWVPALKHLEEEELSCESDDPLDSGSLIDKLENITNPHYKATSERIAKDKAGYPCLGIARRKRRAKRVLLESVEPKSFEYEAYFDRSLFIE